MIYNILCVGRYDNYIQLFTMGRYRDNIMNCDKLKTNYRDKKYSLSPKPTMRQGSAVVVVLLPAAHGACIAYLYYLTSLE